jgi:nickel transport protein
MLSLLSLFALLIPVPVHAHKVTVFAWVEGETVHTESKFSGGKKVKAGKIEVFDHLSRKVLEGKTDDQGYFAFPLPKDAQTLKIVLTAGMGHGNYWQITGQELGRQNPEPSGQPSGQPPKASPSQDKRTQLDVKALEQIVARVVEKELAPLKAQLAAQAWGLRDIVSGIGYILGLMGLASYVHYRKTKTAKPD